VVDTEAGKHDNKDLGLGVREAGKYKGEGSAQSWTKFYMYPEPLNLFQLHRLRKTK
jgi:hypothetical protein